MGLTQDMLNNMQTATGVTGLFSIVVTLVSIVLIWFIMQEIKWEAFFAFPRSPKARMFQAVIAIILGHAFASFILDYWSWTTMLKSFVE
ncbi:DUF1146 domain-containing protein [Paenibacillus sp. Leaf72]|uniref:DUF1146 domain-containing protein n=1 Tax=Paenibacillus sp. Leaf72 TaxID=1736234 RepID=UPI0006F5B246|nr:DUF1146 domain-containing protein [Paenibacillus sp. Leaf72]KQO10965.1 hypothetical protein ASF12_11365 [Paenibacillus sp. Leaf72]